jgi:hypothetical protein
MALEPGATGLHEQPSAAAPIVQYGTTQEERGDFAITGEMVEAPTAPPARPIPVPNLLTRQVAFLFCVVRAGFSSRLTRLAAGTEAAVEPMQAQPAQRQARIAIESDASLLGLATGQSQAYLNYLLRREISYGSRFRRSVWYRSTVEQPARH